MKRTSPLLLAVLVASLATIAACFPPATRTERGWSSPRARHDLPGVGSASARRPTRDRRIRNTLIGVDPLAGTSPRRSPK